MKMSHNILKTFKILLDLTSIFKNHIIVHEQKCLIFFYQDDFT